MNLSDREKEYLKQLIDAGEPLPPKYRLLLFADAPEVELIWQGKTSEVTSVVLPFQSIEQIDEPRAETTQTMDLFHLDPEGRQAGGWTNKLIWGDNKLVLSSLKNGPLRRETEKVSGLKRAGESTTIPSSHIVRWATGPRDNPAPVPRSGINDRVCYETDLTGGIIYGASSLDQSCHLWHNADMSAVDRPLFWVGSARDDLREFPEEVKRFIGFASRRAQAGSKHMDAKPLKGFEAQAFLRL